MSSFLEVMPAEVKCHIWDFVPDDLLRLRVVSKEIQNSVNGSRCFRSHIRNKVAKNLFLKVAEVAKIFVQETFLYPDPSLILQQDKIKYLMYRIVRVMLKTDLPQAKEIALLTALLIDKKECVYSVHIRDESTKAIYSIVKRELEVGGRNYDAYTSMVGHKVNFGKAMKAITVEESKTDSNGAIIKAQDLISRYMFETAFCGYSASTVAGIAAEKYKNDKEAAKVIFQRAIELHHEHNLFYRDAVTCTHLPYLDQVVYSFICLAKEQLKFDCEGALKTLERAKELVIGFATMGRMVRETKLRLFGKIAKLEARIDFNRARETILMIRDGKVTDDKNENMAQFLIAMNDIISIQAKSDINQAKKTLELIPEGMRDLSLVTIALEEAKTNVEDAIATAKLIQSEETSDNVLEKIKYMEIWEEFSLQKINVLSQNPINLLRLGQAVTLFD